MKTGIALLLLVTGFFCSCNFDTVKPSASGKPGELIVVIDTTVWKSETGRILRDSLMMAIPGLPQEEPSLTVVTISPLQFKNLLQNHRNVLMVETGPVAGDKPHALTMKRDLWSTPQLVLNLRAQDKSLLREAVINFAATIRERFLEEDRSRLMEKLKTAKNSKVSEELKELFGITFPLTDDYYIAKKEPNYMWIRKETANSSFGFQVYKFPYESDAAFNHQSVIAIRDSISQKHIPGPLSGSYMTTDKNYPLTFSTNKVSDAYSVQVKGLWRTEGDFMGGPFLSYLILNRNNSELLFIDAYIYAPKYNKREYTRQMDAMVNALSFSEK